MVTDVIAEKFPAAKLEQGDKDSAADVSGEASSAAASVGAGSAPPPPSALKPRGVMLRCNAGQDGLHTLCNCIHASRIYL